MPGEVVRFAIYSIRNERQDSSAYQRREESGRAERGSECCWLSQRGSNWMQTQFACPVCLISDQVLTGMKRERI